MKKKVEEKMVIVVRYPKSGRIRSITDNPDIGFVRRLWGSHFATKRELWRKVK